MPNETYVRRFTVDIDRSAQDFILVRCHGEFVSGVTDILHREVRPLLADQQRVVLDLKDLTYLDSAGLGMIMRLYVSAKSSGCDLALANIGPRVRQLLGITDLLSVLRIIGENNIRL